MANPGKSELKLEMKKHKENGSSGGSGAKMRRCSVKRSSVTDNYDHQGSSYKAITDVSVHKCWPSEESKNCCSVTTKTHLSEFSFSIIHLLSAVCAALLAPLSSVENVLANRKPVYCSNWSINDRTCAGTIDYKECFRENLPRLTLLQITHLVRSRSGDSRILECKEPLVELVKGALNVFVSEALVVGLPSSLRLTS